MSPDLTVLCQKFPNIQRQILILKNKILHLEYDLCQSTNTDTVFPTSFSIFYYDLDISLQITPHRQDHQPCV